MLCVGYNYKSHNAEMSWKDLPEEPIWFDKPMSALLIPGQPLKLDPSIHTEIHHEIELGLVIGMRGKHIKQENVMKHISGYFLGIDFSNRVH